ncbi:MAG: hypothetical protein GWN67_02050 [Phycisphaerae bacterium]|nr:hypothetical protein [Phycisphaerae bacterium]NIU55214.1 hypothetical protein [Phycisphaerae bacterium]NIW91892.1 hypothetical protein [Phycisphaerae bacterium]NIX26520.1 hypothetical protein [Phycisphaerae bacterium]
MDKFITALVTFIVTVFAAGLVGAVLFKSDLEALRTNYELLTADVATLKELDKTVGVFKASVERKSTIRLSWIQ